MSGRPIYIFCLFTVVAGCAAPAQYDEPYALIEPGLRSVTRKEAPAFIQAVDGQIPVAGSRYPIPVAPGKHVVEVYFSTGSSAGEPDKHRRTIDIDAVACTRYRVVARYVDLVYAQWDPVVYSEPVGECLTKFPRAASGRLG
jgi:hypothetical protein